MAVTSRRSIPEAGADLAGGEHPGVVLGYQVFASDHVGQGHRLGGVAVGGDHYPADALGDAVDAGAAEAGGEQAVGGGGGAAPLIVAEDGDP